MKKLLLVLLAAFTLWSCAVIQPTSQVGSKQPSIYNTQWIAQDVQSGTAPTLLIEDNRVAGNASCNSYFGSLSLNPSVGGFQASQLGSTKKACEDMTAEDNFINLLSSANQYVVKGNTLELYKGNLLLIRFVKR